MARVCKKKGLTCLRRQHDHAPSPVDMHESETIIETLYLALIGRSARRGRQLCSDAEEELSLRNPEPLP